MASIAGTTSAQNSSTTPLAAKVTSGVSSGVTASLNYYEDI